MTLAAIYAQQQPRKVESPTHKVVWSAALYRQGKCPSFLNWNGENVHANGGSQLSSAVVHGFEARGMGLKL